MYKKAVGELFPTASLYIYFFFLIIVSIAIVTA